MRNIMESVGYVMLGNDNPFGYFFIAFFDTNVIYVHSVYISEKFRGKHLCFKMLNPILSGEYMKKYRL